MESVLLSAAGLLGLSSNIGGYMRFMLCIVAFAATLSLACLSSLARDNGQYAQVDPATRHWFKSQKSPKTGISCCDISDGVYAEEDIRNGHYWARFVANGIPVDWMQVPDDVVIHDANRNGAPVVWFMMFWDKDNKFIPEIRCYAPGGGV